MEIKLYQKKVASSTNGLGFEVQNYVLTYKKITQIAFIISIEFKQKRGQTTTFFAYIKNYYDICNCILFLEFFSFDQIF